MKRILCTISATLLLLNTTFANNYFDIQKFGAKPDARINNYSLSNIHV